MASSGSCIAAQARLAGAWRCHVDIRCDTCRLQCVKKAAGGKNVARFGQHGCGKRAASAAQSASGHGPSSLHHDWKGTTLQSQPWSARVMLASKTRGGGLKAGSATASLKSLAETEAVEVVGDKGQFSDKIPASPGIYAIYNKSGALQYVGISRKVSFSLANHAARLPELVAMAKIATIDSPDRNALQEAWKSWVEEHVATSGSVPPGNVSGDSVWKDSARRPPKIDLRLTPGAHVQLTVPMETLIDKVVKDIPIVAFIKGTRATPQCGFSHRVLMSLNKQGVDYEVINVLDEEYNPGVREAVKAYSSWPTIPQVFVNGELIGGADLLEESVEKGEFKQLLAAKKSD